MARSWVSGLKGWIEIGPPGPVMARGDQLCSATTGPGWNSCGRHNLSRTS